MKRIDKLLINITTNNGEVMNEMVITMYEEKYETMKMTIIELRHRDINVDNDLYSMKENIMSKEMKWANDEMTNQIY